LHSHCIRITLPCLDSVSRITLGEFRGGIEKRAELRKQEGTTKRSKAKHRLFIFASATFSASRMSLKKKEMREEEDLERLPMSPPHVKEFPRLDERSWVSQFFFLWFFSVLQYGFRNKVVKENLPPVSKFDNPRRLFDKFTILWEAETTWAKGEAVKKGDFENWKSHVRILRVMLQVVGFKILGLAFFLATVQGALQASVPFVSKELIISLSEPNPSRLQQAGLACGIILLPLIGSLCQARVMYMSKRGSQHLFSVFTQAIFSKALRLSSASRNLSSTGQIVTLMSTDAGTSMERAILLIYPLFLAPPLIAVLLYLVYREIGVSAYAGLAMIFIATPLNIFVFLTIMRTYQKIIRVTDTRMKLVNEAVQAIRVLKMYAWELPFVKKIMSWRSKEIKLIRKHAYFFSVGLNAVFLQLPFLIQYFAFATYYLKGELFVPAIIFTAIQLFQALQQSLTQLPSAVSQLTQTIVAARRIQNFLLLEELQSNNGNNFIVDENDFKFPLGSLRIDNGVFRWDEPSISAEKDESTDEGSDTAEEQAQLPKEKSDGVALRNINLCLKPGTSCAIIGPVASSKSSLLAAILGELETLSGSIKTNGKIAFAPQTPWIVSTTIRENILFGLPFDNACYRRVLDICCLRDDLNLFDDGDQTFIGERGINLSGGQRARISLARAVYADADIVILDDPLSAVDAHVGAAIFDNCIKGELIAKKKTLLWVTNKFDRLNDVNHVVVLLNGEIKEQGPWSTLKKTAENILEAENHVREESRSSSTPASGADRDDAAEPLKREESKWSEADEDKNKSKLYDEEEEAIGTLKFSVLWFYVIAASKWIFLPGYTLYMLYLFTPLAAQYVLSYWTDEVLCNLVGTVDCNTDFGERFWFNMYTTILLGGIFICMIAAIFIAEARVHASRFIHRVLLEKTFSAGITNFFDVTPAGRVLNKFSKDMNTIDMNLAQLLMFGIVTIGLTFASFVGIILGTSGLFSIVIIPIFLLYIYIYRYTRTTAIQLQRLEATSRSPIYGSFAEVLNGLKTIRAFRDQHRFLEKNRTAVELNIRAFFLIRVTLPSWLQLAVNLLGLLISSSVCAFVLLSELIEPGEAGLALTYAINIVQTLNATTMVNTEVEILLNSVERIKKFIDDLEPEDQLLTQVSGKKKKELRVEPNESTLRVPPDWPSMGRIEFRDYVTGYRSGPDVLHGINLTIEPGDKVGVVGRTGSGKSTTAAALLRVVEARSGSIVIDGIDISEVSLQVLRSRIAIIPQEPVCFIGTIRFNLDPFGSFSDEELRECLRQVQLFQFVHDLDFEVAEGGDNISVGQRQMICFGRAMLRNARVLILDEATSNLDSESDVLIQEMVRQVFVDQTMITIAHRLQTIMDSDRVLTLENGRVAEFDKPQTLLANRDSIFAGMVRAERNKS